MLLKIKTKHVSLIKEQKMSFLQAEERMMEDPEQGLPFGNMPKANFLFKHIFVCLNIFKLADSTI